MSARAAVLLCVVGLCYAAHQTPSRAPIDHWPPQLRRTRIERSDTGQHAGSNGRHIPRNRLQTLKLIQWQEAWRLPVRDIGRNRSFQFRELGASRYEKKHWQDASHAPGVPRSVGRLQAEAFQMNGCSVTLVPWHAPLALIPTSLARALSQRRNI